MKNHHLIFKSLNSFIYVSFCLASLLLAWEVLQNYKSLDSSFKRKELPLRSAPATTICFNGNKTFTYGTHFNISKFDTLLEFTKGKNEHVLRENEFVSQSKIKLVKLISVFYGTCYRITFITTSRKLVENTFDVFSISFEKSIPVEDIPELHIHFTSEVNSYGITRSHWLDGDDLSFEMNKDQTFLEIGLKEEHYTFLDSKSKCRIEPFYECFGSRFVRDQLSNCSKKCLPHSLPEKTMPQNTLTYCDFHSVEKICASKASLDIKTNLITTGKCLEKSCSTIQFTGKITLQEKSRQSIHTKSIAFYYLPPVSMTVYEEYLIYDFARMLGSIGGTLGMCIGFSFVGMCSFMLIQIQKLFNYINSNVDTDNEVIPDDIEAKLASMELKLIRRMEKLKDQPVH